MRVHRGRTMGRFRCGACGRRFAMPAGMEVECPECGAIEEIEWLDYELLAKVLGWDREPREGDREGVAR